MDRAQLLELLRNVKKPKLSFMYGVLRSFALQCVGTCSQTDFFNYLDVNLLCVTKLPKIDTTDEEEIFSILRQLSLTQNVIEEYKQDDDRYLLEREETFFHRIVKAGNFSLMETLIKRGCDVNIGNSRGNTPLLELVFNYGLGEQNQSRYLMIKNFIELYDPSLNRANHNGVSALSYAITAVIPELVEMFINKGAKLPNYHFNFPKNIKTHFSLIEINQMLEKAKKSTRKKIIDTQVHDNIKENLPIFPAVLQNIVYSYVKSTAKFRYFTEVKAEAPENKKTEQTSVIISKNTFCRML